MDILFAWSFAGVEINPPASRAPNGPDVTKPKPNQTHNMKQQKQLVEEHDSIARSNRDRACSNVSPRWRALRRMAFTAGLITLAVVGVLNANAAALDHCRI